MTEYHKALKVLMKSPVTDDMIRFLTNTTLKVLPNVANSYPTPPGSPSKARHDRLPSLMTFISRLVRHTNVYTSTLLTTACYLNKLKCILPKDASGLPSTIHRMFLACLILSAKFHNDSSPLNRHWAKYTDGLFSLDDINLMERQLIQLLNWDLRVTNDDLILDLRPLLEPIVEDIERTSRQRKKLQRQMLRKSCAGTTGKFYEHQRNISICSDLSSATLVESRSNSSLRLEKEIWNDQGLPTSTSCDSLVEEYGNTNWNTAYTRLENEFNQVLLQHGF